MRALVTGSTGYIGSRLVPALLNAGVDVLAGARDVDKLADFDTSDQSAQGDRARTATSVELDVLDVDSCRHALTDHGRVDVAYYLVHGLGEGDFSETDLQAARTFGQAAAAAGVGRIVYLGGLVPEGEELSEHLRSRRAVAHALRESGVDLVWLRAAIILGAGSTSYELIRHLVRRLVVIPTPAWMNHGVQPIAVDDVVHYLRHSASGRVAPDGYDIAGTRALPYRDLVATFARVAGLRRWLLPVRGVSTGLASHVISALVPLPAPLVRDLVDSLDNTMVANNERLRDLVPAPEGGWTELEEALRRSALVPGAPVQGAGASPDPLRPATTDPDWAA